MDEVDNTIDERCEECDAETPHAVEIYVDQSGDGVYSNEPHRRTECAVCGTTTEQDVGGHCS